MAFGRIFVMPAHFPVFKNAQVVLEFEILHVPQARDLAMIIPCGEVIAESLIDHMRYEFLERLIGSKRAEHERLAPSRIVVALATEAEPQPRIAHERMIGRIQVPEEIFDLIQE